MHARSINGILEGRKTQTRRIVKGRRSDDGFLCVEMADGSWWPYASYDGESFDDGKGCEVPLSCHFGVPGDRLWVRETWAMNDVKHGWGKIPKSRPVGFGEVAYRADGEWKDQFAELDGDIPPWRPSIFMPRWASRLTLEVTEIRVGRAQDISGYDAKAEGVVLTSCGSDHERHEPACFINEFEKLWNDTNGPGAWERNDWVWVVGFRRLP